MIDVRQMRIDDGVHGPSAYSEGHGVTVPVPRRMRPLVTLGVMREHC